MGRPKVGEKVATPYWQVVALTLLPRTVDSVGEKSERQDGTSGEILLRLNSEIFLGHCCLPGP